MSLVAFVIPIRHPANTPDYPGLVRRLEQTARSIAAQSHPDWRAVVVANEGAELPPLPPGFEIVRVDFPPNPNYRPDGEERFVFEESVRLDKGRRILAGMLKTRESAYQMVVDDDDFISRKIVGHVAENKGAAGWSVRRGYLWSEGQSVLYPHDDFSNFCGTSHIVRTDLLRLPETFQGARIEYIKAMLGSHVKIERILQSRGTPLGELPFRGAIYRVGYGASHSISGPALTTFWTRAAKRRNPLALARQLGDIRFLGGHYKQEFFGE